MAQLFRQSFDIAAFLANAGLGRKIVQLAPKQTFFSQGDPADAVFYLQTGRAIFNIRRDHLPEQHSAIPPTLVAAHRWMFVRDRKASKRSNDLASCLH